MSANVVRSIKRKGYVLVKSKDGSACFFFGEKSMDGFDLWRKAGMKLSCFSGEKQEWIWNCFCFVEKNGYGFELFFGEKQGCI